MYAIIVTGGKQYRVMTGETLRVEKLDVEAGSAVELNTVLMLGDGENITIGTPNIAGALVKATVKSHGRLDKIRIVKFRCSCPSAALHRMCMRAGSRTSRVQYVARLESSPA